MTLLEPVIEAFTPPVMIDIENHVVVNAQLVSDQLILTQYNGTITNVGNVRGPAGLPAGGIAEIGNAVNLNSMTTIGWYSQSTNAEAATGTNYPVPQAGMLQVVRDKVIPTMVWQTYSVYRGSSFGESVWTRAFYNGLWSPWQGVGGTTWIDLPGLVPGPTAPGQYTAYGGSYQLPKYKIFGSTVYIRGLLKAVYALGASSKIIAYTPVDAPPVRRSIFAVSGDLDPYVEWATVYHYHYISALFSARVDIRPNVTYGGDIYLTLNNSNYNIAAGSYLSLSGMSYEWK